MKRTLSLIFLSALIVLICSGYSGGCATYSDTGNEDYSTVKSPDLAVTPAPTYRDPYADVTPTVIPTVVIKRGSPLKIISEPSGAVIEIDNMYVGKTPLTIVVNDYCKYCFDCASVNEGEIDVCESIGLLNINMVNIKATPIKKGYVQEKFLTCRQFFDGGKVFFNTNLVPASK
jgi:hypothetical protein